MVTGVISTGTTNKMERYWKTFFTKDKIELIFIAQCGMAVHCLNQKIGEKKIEFVLKFIKQFKK